MDLFKQGRKVLFRRLLLAVIDILTVAVASIGALLLRFDLSFDKIQEPYLGVVINLLPVATAVTIVILWILRLYSSLWTYAGIRELERVVLGSFLSTAFYAMLIYVFHYGEYTLPRSFYFLYFFVLVVILSISRFGYRIVRTIIRNYVDRRYGSNVMVIGAGEAGSMIIREMTNNDDTHKTVCCVIDDSREKIGNYILGAKVVGSTEDIPYYAEKYNIREIIIAIPSISKKETGRIVGICKTTKCALKILPGIKELVDGGTKLSQLRNVEIEDLLERGSIDIDIDSVMGFVTGKTVLVTGGGGSIGSELCRQLARHGVGRLLIVDIYENNAYDIEQELRRDYPELDLIVMIASVRNTKRIDLIFEQYKPEIVFHAAAHKHVPLMEVSPNEAVKNNVYGTLKTVRAADKHGVERFILISTDKAVNPTNVMGATKRLCEMIIQTYDRISKTEFVAVRFGNVLGSNGSVIPLFKKQIEEGGPVTVTHPDIVRFFMTIPEAVSLVLQAGAFAKGGEIFVLDMGEPVKIRTLAENLIRLSGYVPYQDIDIKFTGLRPGEKLYEEVLMDEEGLQNTANSLIHIGKPIKMDYDDFLAKIDALYDYVKEEPDDIREKLMELVPTYKPAKN
ncbi:MAG: polysaccharide biosynthesis protein [Lachnospiraceae bacterium]|nr:polysaccharide biosynthesis protein [Lachnospiraceae bacterium]